jgi:multiple sugar transport system ATP-binding protein
VSGKRTGESADSLPFHVVAETADMLDRITKRFKSLTAVNGVDLAVYPGEKLVIIGPSGSSKSTLLRSITPIADAKNGGKLF